MDMHEQASHHLGKVQNFFYYCQIRYHKEHFKNKSVKPISQKYPAGLDLQVGKIQSSDVISTYGFAHLPNNINPDSKPANANKQKMA